MFGTSIHWTTFFYLLLDIVIVLITLYFASKNKNSNYKRFLTLGFLFIAYNVTGGFLPIDNFPGPFILQYIITYGIAITMCIYIVYYLYKEYDIVVLQFRSSIKNLALLCIVCFHILFLGPYFVTGSLDYARFSFTVPIAIAAFIFLRIFYKRISNPKNPNKFILRRNKLSIVSVACIALLPIFTVIGDYQWLTFTNMNIAFYAITVIEVDRYLYIVENKAKMYEVYALNNITDVQNTEQTAIYENLTRREIEIALAILSNSSYKNIGKELFIAESTVSKHASNIYKKTGVKNRKQFIKRFKTK
ncbi:helix-turn-helix domain-containing protein [Marinirhabdus gelatinilytica]|uniref:Regulatory LuxR family protein n=1 Tax=Marinirhabdus gelatinilytica TaxID=1703343 RepID=A0A370QLI4_9FLAO|nr:helix-turn-helix transcriptional regulator [Marinirhabdus gelatinilytica]RDK89209.1 regulatory LuxR family protein [Marinirhabdus gelatinilytica]